MNQPQPPDAVSIRRPVVAGRFYPGDAAALRREVEGYLVPGRPEGDAPTLLAMVPHAGYVFSGAVAGRTIGAARLADTLILLGPNHTGLGRRLAVWESGAWSVPGFTVPVDGELAAAFLAAEPRLVADRAAHRDEHSLEVVLPFVCVRRPDCRIVPVAVAEPGPEALRDVALSMAGVLLERDQAATVLVSSDMSHYVTQDAARRLDARALARAVALDPEGLYRVVREEGISMCGVLPMVLGIHLAKALGAREAALVDYATSGETTGDFDQVVGYAGILAW